MNLIQILTLPLQRSKTNCRNAIFPGSFDPFHEGHYNILIRANEIFDNVIVLVANNYCKKSSPINERVLQVKKYLQKYNLTNKVASTYDLTVDYAIKNNCKYLIRGIRNKKDFNYEMKLANINKKLSKEIETIFFFAENKYINLRSNKLKKLF